MGMHGAERFSRFGIEMDPQEAETRPGLFR